MTALTPQSALPGRTTWLRRLGGVAIVLALTALGLGSGLWLGSPASAATPPLKVNMGAGWVTSTPTPLLDLAGLAPGGSTAGSMGVLDDSDYGAGSGMADTITLRMTDIVAADGKVAGAGVALQNALEFTVAVAGASGTIPAHGALHVADLAAGITLASGLVNGNILSVTATAALPAAVGNAVQYGSLSFKLQVELTSAGVGGGQGGQGGQAGNGGGTGQGGQQGSGDDQGDTEVLGTSQTAPDDSKPDTNRPDEVLVLGESGETLPNTGVPAVTLLIAGGAVLLVGVGLLLLGRRRKV